jgi:hypothetical protein
MRFGLCELFFFLFASSVSCANLMVVTSYMDGSHWRNHETGMLER